MNLLVIALLTIFSNVYGPLTDLYQDSDLFLTHSIFDTTDIRNYGAIGDGVTDDTEAIRRAIQNSKGSIQISGGRFRITETIEITKSTSDRISISGDVGSGTVIMAGAGPAFRFVGSHEGTSNPASVNKEVWLHERMPIIENLEIIGAHTEADGLEFQYTMQPTVRGVLIREVRHGIILRERIRNFILDSSHIYNCSGMGLLLDRVNLHQANIQGNHISYCKQGGIRSIGSEIRNLQITGNDIEYNYDQKAEQSADIWIDSREGSVREGTINSNTLQSVPVPGGANIRFIGAEQSYNKTGLWSITGNHISNATQNIHIVGGRGFTITGNTFIRGRDRNMLLENSRNIIYSANSVDNNPDYQEETGNGITIQNSQGVILSAFQLEFAGNVDERLGGVEIRNSREISITGCQLFFPVPTGIFVENSKNIQIEQCLIQGAKNGSDVQAAIKVVDKSSNVMIRNNITTSGKKGEIITDPGTSILEGNHHLDW